MESPRGNRQSDGSQIVFAPRMQISHVPGAREGAALVSAEPGKLARLGRVNALTRRAAFSSNELGLVRDWAVHSA